MTIEITSFTTNRSPITNFVGTNNIDPATPKRISQDGWIVGVDVQRFGATKIPQRGQFYMTLVVGNNVSEYSVLTQGYWFEGHDLKLGTYIEAGPAGGHGMLTQTVTANPGAGVEVAATSVPTGAIQRIHSFFVSLTQGITQTPLPQLVIKRSGGGSLQIAQIPAGPTAQPVSTTVAYTWLRGGTDTQVLTAGVATDVVVKGIGDFFLIATDTIETLTIGIGANSDYTAANIELEEWVVPN